MMWFFMRGPGGSIACKAGAAALAKQEAAERWGCSPEEITVTGTEEYRGAGEDGLPRACGPRNDKTKAAGAVAAAPTAEVERTDCHGPAALAMTKSVPSASNHNTF